ncbi:MAG: DNA translocase FtsK, partial [Bacteroidales bacterium]|nr:DNA translocase FtsK [Bacteroidales bacterium]
DMPILEKETTEVEEDDEKKNEIEDEQKFSKEKITVRTIELPEEPPVQDDVKDEPTIDDTLPMPPIAGEDILIEDIKPQQPGPMENETTSEEEPIEEKEKSAFDVAQLPPYDPRADLPDYQFPTTDMLEEYVQETRSKEQKLIEIGNNKQRIKDTLSNYGIEISSISATEGPTITMYEIVPAPGVRISKIKGLEDDIALSLSALGIRIIAPIPGKGTIGIEVPNAHPQIVPMKDVIMSDKFQNANKMALPVAIGKTISNEVFVFDLAKMPHVLMAGATGQGKSVGLNAVLTSLLYKKHPAELKFVLVDPKKVELTLYSKIERHYLAKLPDSDEAIITDTHKVVKTLTSLCNEMDQRYELLKSAQCRNIIEYNEKFKARRLNPENGHRFLPYIVLVFDEFADCIMTAGREVEQPIARLAQLARAIGIHLIIATQRPSVNIITGVIKANFPARIAFRVSSSTDSRTILDTTGAQNLIGRGDMLISTGNELTRVQCALVDTPEVEKICEFIGEQRGYTGAFHLPEVIDDNGGTQQEVDDGEFDPCFADAARMVVQNQQGSTSFLQRKLKLGYNRAGRIMDQLEREKIVGPSLGSKVREVYIKDEVALDELLKNLNLL